MVACGRSIHGRFLPQRNGNSFLPYAAPHMAFRGGTGACAHTHARMFSLFDGVVLSRVRLCSRRSLVLMPLSAVGVVIPRDTCAWLWRSIAVGARTRACAHARLLRSPCSLGRSYRRKSTVYLLVSRLWMQIIARSRSCLRLNFVVPLVAVACLGSRARASARMRDPLLVGRR